MKTRRGPIGRGFSRKSVNRARPVVERVEDRLLLTTFVVNNTGDNGPGSLRDAITLSNADNKTLPNRIDFSGLPAGLNTIALQTPLPQISTSVTIDGTTATGFVPASPSPAVTIDGTRASTGTIFDIGANDVVIRSLDINNFSSSGITINSGNNDVIAGCYIGLDMSGTRAGRNLGTGILVNTAGNATIGGTTPADRNVISGVNQGIQVATATGFATIQGNYIGTNAQGTAALGAANKGNGIELDAGFNTIRQNVISNYAYGIQILNNADFNTVSGNFIGTDYTGNARIGNTFDGIYINSSARQTIGTYTNLTGTGLLGAGNVISGNGRDGIQVSGFSPSVRIQSNLIGVGADKTTRLGNGFYGVLFNGGGGSSTIGGAVFQTTVPNEIALEAAMGNVIAYNGAASPILSPAAGILITGGSGGYGILSNSIFGNTGKGIQLNGANFGVTPPTITAALSGGRQTKITGTLFERATNETYRIQLFSTSTAGNGEGQKFLGDFDVITDSLGNATINFTLPTSAPIGSYITATATERVTVFNNSSEFSSPVQIGQAIVADVGVTVSPAFGSPPTPLVGQPFVYAVTVTNRAPGGAANDNATGVILTDTLPANSILIPAFTTPGATLANGVLTYNIGNLANGASQTFFVAVRPTTTTGKFTDSASVTSADIDPDLTNNSDSNTPANGVQPDATITTSIVLASNPTPVGAPLTFVVTVSNQGPSTANNSVVTITLDPSFTNIIVEPDQGTATVAGNVVTVTTGILPSGSGSTINLTATPTATGNFTTTASVTSSIINPTTGTNTSVPVSVPVSVANAADLGVQVSGPPSVLAGQQLVYTVTVTNNGPSTATTPVVVDTLPPGVTFDPANSSDSGGGTLTLVNGTVVARLQPLAAGASDTIKIAVTPTVSGQITNLVTVADPDAVNPTEIDIDPTNNSAAGTTLVSPADVGVTILNPTDPLFIGTQVAFQVQVTNGGPAVATNVTLVDTLGSGVRIVGATISPLVGTASIQPGSNVVTANIGTIASGATVTVTILVDPTTSGTLSNDARVTATEIDPNPNNNTSSTSNLINPVDLAVAIAGTPATVILGTPVTFTVTVTNAGPSTATNVQFNGTLPAGATFVSATPSQGSVAPSGAMLTGNLGTLAPGASATVMITLIPTAGTSIAETSSVRSDDVDTNAGNDSATATLGVINLPGTIVFSSPTYTFPENSGTVAITLNRVNGSQGTVSVDFTTADASAVAGVNYVATSGTVTFLDGQTTAMITIPVLDDRIINGGSSFVIRLTGTGGGASLDSNNVATVVLTNTDRDAVPPTVTGFTALTSGKSLTGFVITFSEALDPTRASDVSNYHVFLSNRDAGKGPDQEVTLAAAIYDPSSNTVRLVPAGGSLPGNRFYHIVVNGSVGNAITDLSGNILADRNGVQSNFETFYGQGSSLRFIDSGNNVVTISLGGKGTISIVRAANGDADSVNLSGIVRHKSKLTGTVKKLMKSSSGHTRIGSITGLGQFGDVRSSLTTPRFYVTNPPVFTTSGTTSGTVSAFAVPSPTVKVTRATVRGPLGR